MQLNDQDAIRLKVLKAIRRAEPVARTDLVGLTGVSSAAISKITGELIERGFLAEVTEPGRSRGRPRAHLSLRPDAAHVLGAYLLPDGMIGVEISNARGESQYVRTEPFGLATTAPAMAGEIAGVIERALAESSFGKDQIEAVACAIPATVDSERGVLHWWHSHSGAPVPLAALLEERLGLPVTVENHINVMARAEHWFAEDRQVDDFSLFTIGGSLGFGEYLHGALRIGAHGLNSEFSHLKTGDTAGPVCICGGRGCLAALASTYGIVANIAGQRGDPPFALGSFGAQLAPYAADAHSGEPIALAAFERAGRHLGTAIGNHVNASDPARIIVLSSDPAYAALILPALRQAMDEAIFAPLRGRAPIAFKAADQGRYSQGIAALLLERLYRSPGRHRP